MVGRRPLRLLGCVAWAWSLVMLGADPVSAPPKPVLDIGCTFLGLEGVTLNAEQLATALSDAGWCTARAARPPPTWRRLQPGRDLSKWVSVVTTGFGEHGDAMAFMFAGPEGGLSLVAHAEYWKVPVHGTKQWQSPLGALAEKLPREWAQANRLQDRPQLSLAVGAKGRDEGGSAIGANLELSGGDGVNTMGAEKTLPAIEALAWAAAWQAGWAPTAAKAEHTLKLVVRFQDRACSFQANYDGPLGRTAIVRENVPQADYLVGLQRLFLYVRRQQELRDLGQVPGGAVQVVALAPDRICYMAGSVLCGFAPSNGKLVWPPQKEDVLQGPAAGYVARAAPDGQPVIYRYTGVLAVVDPATGKEQALAPGGAAFAWAFDVGADQTVVTAVGAELRCFRKGQEVWKAPAKVGVTCGPLVSADRVFAGTESGDFLALAAADGKEVWRATRVGGFTGAPVVAGGHVVAFSGSSETLAAFSADRGQPAWELPVGDILLEPLAAPAPDLVFVAGKNNRLLVVKAAAGTVVAERVWPTWLLSALPLKVGDRVVVACTDLHGVVTFLSWPELKTVGEVPSLGHLSAGLSFAPDFTVSRPESLSDDEELGTTARTLGHGPALLVCDRDGFYYVVAVPGTPNRK